MSKKKGRNILMMISLFGIMSSVVLLFFSLVFYDGNVGDVPFFNFRGDGILITQDFAPIILFIGLFFLISSFLLLIFFNNVFKEYDEDGWPIGDMH